MPKFLLPGHNYLGPGNPLENGPTTNKADAVAKVHDYAYHNAQTKTDIFAADRNAISEFLNTNSLSGYIGATGLGIKNLTESVLDRTLYPWNMPIVGGKRSGSEQNTVNSKVTKNDHTVPSISNNSLPSAGDNVEEMDTDAADVMLGDAPTEGNPGASNGSAHGQTARVFNGYPEEPDWVEYSFKKTYRWTGESGLPKFKKASGEVIMKIGGAYFIPVENIFWYLSYNEFYNLMQNYEIVELLEANCDVYNYGIRLPFTTNEADSVTANASAQYPLCQWIGLESDYRLYRDPVDVVDVHTKVCGNANWYGKASDDWQDFKGTATDNWQLSARATSREFHLEACVVIPTYQFTKDALLVYTPNLNSYAQTVNGTMNLGKVFTWHHKIQHGCISQRHFAKQKQGLSSVSELSTFPQPYNFLPGTTTIGNKDDAKQYSTRDYHLGASSANDDEAAWVHLHRQAAIDGWPALPHNNAYITKTKIKPFIIGTQFLRNKNDTELKANFEFVTTCTLKLRCRRGTKGIYSDYAAKIGYVGINPTIGLGSDGHLVFPTKMFVAGHDNQVSYYVYDRQTTTTTPTTSTIITTTNTMSKTGASTTTTTSSDKKSSASNYEH